MYIAAVSAVDDGLRQNLIVVDRVELFLQVLLQDVVLVDALDGRLQDVSLLFGEVNQLADLLKVGRRFVEANASVPPLDHETRRADCVDISVYRAGEIESLAAISSTVR